MVSRPFWDLSLTSKLAPEQISVISDLKGTKEQRLLSGKRGNKSKENKLGVKFPSSVSKIKICLKLNHPDQLDLRDDDIDLS